MLRFLHRLFFENVGLKVVSLVMALVCWFYIVNELNKGTEDERQMLKRILPSEGLTAKKLSIKPVLIGRPRSGFEANYKSIMIIPEYCIVVGNKDLLNKVRFAYTMPIDVGGVYKTFTKSIALNPIAPGVFSEETLVQVTVPIEKKG